MPTANHDPRQWDVEQVKQWAIETFPFGQPLACSLNSNDVDGDVLLSHINDETLKNDIGIRSLGQRVKILEKVRDLRLLSNELNHVSACRHQEAATPREVHNFINPFRPALSYETIPQLRLKPLHPDSSSTDNASRTAEYTLTPCGSGRLVTCDLIGTPRSIVSRFRAEKYFPSPITPKTPIRKTSDGVEIPATLSSGDLFLDDISQIVDHASPQQDDDTPAPSKRPINAIEMSSPEPSPRKRRKLQPTYFRTKEMRAIDVMLPSLNPNINKDEPFVVNHHACPTGERLYVQKLIRKLLLNPDIVEFPHLQVTRTVWKLHPEKLIKKHEQHIALVFDTDPASESCQIFTAPIGTLGIPNENAGRNDGNGELCDRPENPFQEDDWDYLEKWRHMTDDTLLPIFLESDEEDAMYDEPTMREMELEARKETGGLDDVKKPLPVDIVREIIEHELSRYADIWADTKLAKLEARMYRIYKKLRRERILKLTVRNHRRELRDVQERLDEYKKEYVNMEWRSEGELRRVCVNMQESVNRKSELVWLINLLSGPMPEKPVSSKRATNGPTDLEDKVVEENEDQDLEGLDEDVDDGHGNDFAVDDMDGFIVDDDEVGDVILPEGHLTIDDEIVDEKDDEIGDESGSSSSRVKRSQTKRLSSVIEDQGRGDAEKEDSGNVAEVGRAPAEAAVIPNSEVGQDALPDSGRSPTSAIPKVLPEDITVDKVPPKSIAISGSVRKEASALPPLSEEIKNSPVMLKEERPYLTDVADTRNVYAYDSDLFICFGDEEIAEFCQCTEKSAKLAKDYLLRADGEPSRAVSLYFEDVDNGRIPESSASISKPLKSKKLDTGLNIHKTNANLTVRASDGRYDKDRSVVAPNFRPSFESFFPRDKGLQEVKALLSNLPSADLHAALIDISGLVANNRLDPSTQFIPGETLENCGSYWKIYRAYVNDLFGMSYPTELSPMMLDKIHNKDIFCKFYDRFIAFLGILPPATPNKTKLKSQLPGNHSQVSISQSSSPETNKNEKNRKDKDKAKKKTIKPVTKSAEQIAQETELRKIADRERNQRKRGTFVTTADDGSIVINLGKKAADDAVCLHPELAKVMKPHQIEGLQFIWLQIVTLARGKGCLLAHTMGLGKTLQIIAFLITLVLLSPNAKVEMPDRLKKETRRFLIVCPPGIVINWENEFKRWTPKGCKDALGTVFCVNQASLLERMKTISLWYENGGVLVIGYSQFRALLSSKTRSEQDQTSLRKWLLLGPDLVVADEAHEIKNEKSQIGTLLNEVQTGSRIATTGSPLSNHLREYWAMMNWIHPGFLGTLRDFTNAYINPIHDGLYADSTRADRTFSQVRLVKLKRLLDDKIQRRDLTSIEADLPSKTEFIVSVGLTPLQRKLYESLINVSTWRTDGQRSLFKWINILRLICNHPYTLMTHIKKREAEEAINRESKRQTIQDEEAADDSKARSRALTVDVEDTEELPPVRDLQWAKQIFEDMGDEHRRLLFTEYSNKSQYVLSIVNEAMNLQENVLIFIHSIPTLQYLQSKLVHKRHQVYVLTGGTPMKERQRHIDSFNKRRGCVYLISSMAGSLGLNITSANRVILYDLAWNPVHDQQAVGRAYRLGQKKHVYVYRLGTWGTYESIFFTENVFKLNLSKRVIDKKNPGRFGIARFDLEKYFFIPKADSESEKIDMSLFEGKDVILDKLIAKSGNGTGPKILELDLTETFHKDEEEIYLTPDEMKAANEEAEREKELREEGRYEEYKSHYSTLAQNYRPAQLSESTLALLSRVLEPVTSMAKSVLPLTTTDKQREN